MGVLRVIMGAVGLLSLALGSSPAVAAPYPPGTCAHIAVSTTKPQAGAPITVTGSGFASNATLTLQLHSTATVLGRVTTDLTGSFRTTVTIPTGLTGTHRLSVVGGLSTCEVVPIDLTVQSGSEVEGETTNPLASTGVQILLGILAALALIVVGSVALFGGSRGRGDRP